MARLMISLLGSFQVFYDGTLLTSFRSNKERALLTYLIVEAAHPHQREGLVGLLWPDQPEELARNNLRKSLARLRQVIRDAEAEPPFLLITPSTVQVNPQSDYRLDVTTFTTLLATCQAHPHRHLSTCQPCHHRLQQAVQLYQGDFLGSGSLVSETNFEEWVVLQRERLQRQMQQVLETLSHYHERHGAFQQAEEYTRRQLLLDPWNEPAHQHLMALLAGSGQRLRALAHYETLRQQLRLDLDVEPSHETTLLYQQIKARALPRGGAAHPPALALSGSDGTPFIGREEALATLRERLLNPDYRLISVVGEGGVGKSRLAQRAIEQVRHDFLDGVGLVSIQYSQQDIATLIAQQLGVPLDGRESPRKQLLNYLRSKEMLLLLDGFERALAEAPFILELLQCAPRIVVLITSREPLNFQREYVLRLGGLPIPRGADTPLAATYASVRLFAERAERMSGRFVLDDETLPLVIEVCQYLNGLPLGIELAASWSGQLSLPALAQHLRESPDLLISSFGDVPESHRSLQAVFEGSWSLLSDRERLLLVQCSLFQGTFTQEATQAIIGASLEEMTTLVKKSLVQQPAPKRYTLHDVTRYFAATKWETILVADALTRAAPLERYIGFYLTWLASQERAIHGPTPQHAIAEIQQELGNLVEAWEVAFSGSSLPDEILACLKAASRTLTRFYMVNGPYEKGEAAFRLATKWLERAPLISTGEERASLLAHFLAYQSQFLRAQARYEEATALAQRAIEQAEIARDWASQALGQLQLGQALRFQGLWAQAQAALEQALQAAQLSEESSLMGLTLFVMGDNLARLGNYEKAVLCGEKGLNICSELEDAFLVTGAFLTLGIIHAFLSDFARARIYYEKAQHMTCQVGDQRNLSVTLTNLGRIVMAVADYRVAERCFSESLQIVGALGDRYGESVVLGNLGRLHYLMGHYEIALDYLQQAFQVGNEVNNPHGDEVLQDMGHTMARLGRWDEAASLYQQTLDFLHTSGLTHRQLGPLSSLAQAMLAQGRIEEAKVQITTILYQLRQDTAGKLENPAEMYLTCYRVLRALGDPQARELLQLAHSAVQEIAHQIPDSPTRRAFLENVAVHREIVEAFEGELDD